jgi:hypothetical protein
MTDDFTKVQNTENIGSPAAGPTSNPPVDLRCASGRPMAVTVFGVLNIVFGIYGLIRIIYPGYYAIMKLINVRVNPENILGPGALILTLLAVGIGLSVWLTSLGVGLLTMKRWARRGCILFAEIQNFLIVIILGLYLIFLTVCLMPPPKDICVFLNTKYALALIYWIYIVLLLIFMRSAKVKEAFGAIGG